MANLQDIFKNKRALAGTFVFHNPWEIDLYCVDPPELSAMLRRSKSDKYGKKAEGEYSDTKLWAELAKKISGWRGLTYHLLCGLTTAELPENVDPESEIVFNVENAETMCREVYGFAAFIMDTVSDIAKFHEQQQEIERKNLHATQGNESV